MRTPPRGDTPGVGSNSTVWKLTPSNEAKPLNVPTHRKPSEVWASEFTVFWGNPRSVSQTSRMNSLTPEAARMEPANHPSKKSSEA